MEPVFSNYSIILKEPKYSENIGSTARAMCNMGFTDLVLVAPPAFDIETIKKTATHEAVEVVNNIRIFTTLKEAVSNSNYVIGTTARLGRQRQEMILPSNLEDEIQNFSFNNRISILFGPEDRGLQNSDISICDLLVNIPTIDFSSINLSHSVMILCYEISKAAHSNIKKPPSRIASKKEIEPMFDYLQEVLNAAGFANPEKPEQYIIKFRQFISRIKIKSKEVIIIKGLLKKILQKIQPD